MKYVIDKMIYTVDEDLHTHTVYSRKHGFGTIEDNVLYAREKGIKTLGITDHGPGHLFYGIKKSDIPKMKHEISLLNEKYDDINILLGVEANIINKNGILDIRPEKFPEYDFVIAGYHYGVLGQNPFVSVINHGYNIFRTRSKKEDLRLMRRNTDYITSALRKNKIKILAHPGDKAPVDLLEVAVVCEETNTLVEINTWHSSLSSEDLKSMALTKCEFILSSDAHSPDRIGDVISGIRLAIEAELDLSRIVNLKVEARID